MQKQDTGCGGPEPHGERERQNSSADFPVAQHPSTEKVQQRHSRTQETGSRSSALASAHQDSWEISRATAGAGRVRLSSSFTTSNPGLHLLLGSWGEPGARDLLWSPTGTWLAERDEGAVQGGVHTLWSPGSHRGSAATGSPEEPAPDPGSWPRHAGYSGTVSGSQQFWKCWDDETGLKPVGYHRFLCGWYV